MSKSPRGLQFERLLFFSDAVFAIAITLLIIDIRLPAERLASEASLQRALLGLIPNYVGFLISFIVIGQFWAGHRQLFSYASDCTPRTLLLNMVLLFAIAFLPFPTAVVNAYGGTTTGVLFYAGWLLFAGVINLLLVHSVHRSEEHLVEPLSDTHRYGRLRAWMPILIASCGIVAGSFYPPAGVIALTLSPMIIGRVIFAMRPKSLRKTNEIEELQVLSMS